MKEILRVRCPCCGQTTDLDRMAQEDANPAVVRVFLEQIGGKKPAPAHTGVYKKVGRGKAPGNINYQEITDHMSKSQLKTIQDWFVKRAAKFLEA